MPAQTVFEQQMEDLKMDMREMRAAITEIAKAMSRLAVMEERNLASVQITEKLAIRLEKVELVTTAAALERATFVAKFEGISSTMKFMWTAFGGGVIFLVTEAIKHFAGR